MDAPLRAALAVVLAYLAGSLPTSYLAGQLLSGIDLRRVGSGNLGATNVFRSLGAAPAAVVMLVDVAKGFAAVTWLPRLAGEPGGGQAAGAGAEALAGGLLPILCAVAAILGHVFPVWLGFRGGKGVATAVGAFLALSPSATAAAVLVWVAAVALVRIVSVASLALGACLPFFVYAERRGDPGGELLVGFAVLASLFVFWTHRENLRRLARGEERRISRAPKGSA